MRRQTNLITMQKIKILQIILLMSLFVETKSFAADVVKLPIEADVIALKEQFARGSISTKALAELALSKSESLQSTMLLQLKDNELSCNLDFFVNSCLQDVRLKRRELQEILRTISIEAKSFLRRSRADKSKNTAEKSDSAANY